MPTLLALLVGYLLSQFYRSFLAVIAPELAVDVGLDGRGLGMVSAAFFGAFALVQLPIGAALDRYGARRTVALPMLSAVVGAAVFSRASSPGEATAAMALIGFGCAPVFMGAMWVIGRTTSPARFALWSSLIVGIGSLGNLAAATPLAAAAAAWGWRTAMLGIAGATLVSALAIAILVRDPPHADGAVATGPRPGLGELLRIRALWPFFPLALISYPTVLAARGLWVGPYFAEVHGLSPIARGDAVMVMVVAMIVGAFAYGPIDRWLGTRKWVAVGGTVATIVGFAALALFPRMPVGAAAIAFGVIGGFGLTYSVLMAHARAFLPTALLGRGLTLLNMGFVGGTAILLPATGALHDALRAGGADVATAHAAIYGGLAVALTAALVVYLWAEDAKP